MNPLAYRIVQIICIIVAVLAAVILFGTLTGCAQSTHWVRENIEAAEFKGGYGDAYARSRFIFRPNQPIDGKDVLSGK